MKRRIWNTIFKGDFFLSFYYNTVLVYYMKDGTEDKTLITAQICYSIDKALTSLWKLPAKSISTADPMISGLVLSSAT